MSSFLYRPFISAFEPLLREYKFEDSKDEEQEYFGPAIDDIEFFIQVLHSREI